RRKPTRRFRMPYRWHVRVRGIATVHDIPGRFGEAGIRELVTAPGGEPAEDEDVWSAAARTFRATPPQQLAERLLDLVLLKPPIPAGCEALVRAMEDAAAPPWLTHEVREDRVWLWYCHRLLHQALPERFPPPAVQRVDLETTALDPAA